MLCNVPLALSENVREGGDKSAVRKRRIRYERAILTTLVALEATVVTYSAWEWSSQDDELMAE